MRFVRLFAPALLLLAAAPALADDKPIAIAEVKHDGQVDFEREILPILKKNCLACHNSTKAESDLVLETPETIRKGGAEGPGVEPGNSEESLLLMLAARQRESYMPPDDNDVGAKQLTPEQLGLIKLWIDQGAEGEVTGLADIQWQPLPPGVSPIYSVGITQDGQYAAAGRANQVFLYHVPSRRELGRLTDPAVLESGVYQQPGVAHLDLVQAVAFSPNGQLLATSGYRNAKIWRRVQGQPAGKQPPALPAAAKALAVSSDGSLAAVGLENKEAVVVDLATGAVLQTLNGHEGPVLAAGFSADNTQLATGSDDKTVRVWKVADGAAVTSIATPSAVQAVAWTGELLATGGADNIIRLWNPKPAEQPAEAKEEEAQEEEAQEEESKEEESKEGDAAAEGAKEGEDAAPQPERELAGHGGPITALAAVDAEQLASASADGTVRIWKVADGAAVRTLTHGGPITSMAVQSGGALIASASDNKTVKLWNTADGKQLHELKGNLRKQLDEAAITRAVALANARIKLAEADLKAGNDRKKAEDDNLTKADEAVKKAETEHTAKVEAAKKPEADKAAADKELTDAKTLVETATAEATKAEEAAAAAAEAATKAQQEATKAAEALDAAAKAAAEAAEQQKTATEAAEKDKENADLAAAKEAADKAAAEAEAAKQKAEEAKAAADKALTDANAKKTEADKAKADTAKAKTDAEAKVKAAEAKVKAAEAPAKKAIDERTAAARTLETAKRTLERAKQAVEKAAAEVPKLEQIVKAETEARDGQQKLLDEAKQATAESEQPWLSAAFSPDGKTLATGSAAQLVHTWDVETGAPLQILDVQQPPAALAFASDGRLLTVGQSQAALIDPEVTWELASRIGAIDSNVFADRVTALAFSPDGKILATGSGEPSRSGEIKLWNAENGEMIREVEEPHSDTVFALSFSRDGQYLASCAADRFMKVFNVADGSFVRAFEGHTHHVLGVSWSADGRTLATSGADNVIKIWDFRTGDQQRTITGFSKELTSIRFVGDSTNVAASCGDKNVHVRRADNGGNVRSLGGGGDFMFAVDASADGKVLIAGGQDSVLRVWDDAGKSLATFEPPAIEEAAEEQVSTK